MTFTQPTVTSGSIDICVGRQEKTDKTQNLAKKTNYKRAGKFIYSNKAATAPV
jgi:hypothetical protein